MTVREQLIIQIDGKADKAINATKKTENAISKLGNFLKGMAIAGGALYLAKKGFDLLSAAMKKTITFLKGCTEAAAFQELQIKKLDTALKSTGTYTEKVSKSLQEYASSLQKVTMYGDETIIGVEAMLATFKLGEEEVKVATQATLDLAAATGQDLQSAAILMGKAMVGETGMLKRYGIIVDENKLKSEGWRAVIEEINTEFGGQAVAQGETYTGMIERMKNIFGDMKEKIGDALIPTLKKLIDWFTTGEDVINRVGIKIGETASPFEKLKTWVSEATTNFGKFLELNWENIIGIATETWTKVESFIKIVKEADYTKIEAGISRITGAFNLLSGSETTGVQGATNKFQSFIDKTGEALHAIGTIVGAFKALYLTGVFVIGGLTNAIITLVELLGDAGPIIMSLGRDTEALDNFRIKVDALNSWSSDAWGNMEKAWKDYVDFMDESSVTSTDKAEQEFAGMKDKISNNFEGISKSAQEFQKAIDNLHGKNIYSTHTITTMERIIHEGRLTGVPRQSGGELRLNQYIPDLGIYGAKGEGIIPEPLMRAIKQGRGSYAGIDVNNSRTSTANEIHIHVNYSEKLAEQTLARLLAQEIGVLNG